MPFSLRQTVFFRSFGSLRSDSRGSDLRESRKTCEMAEQFSSLDRLCRQFIVFPETCIWPALTGSNPLAIHPLDCMVYTVCISLGKKGQILTAITDPAELGNQSSNELPTRPSMPTSASDWYLNLSSRSSDNKPSNRERVLIETITDIRSTSCYLNLVVLPLRLHKEDQVQTLYNRV